MKINSYQILYLFYLSIITITSAKINSKINYKRNYEFHDTKCIGLLNENKRIPIQYHTYSFVSEDTYTFLSDCFYKISDDIVICNDLNLHYVYMFKFQKDNYKLYSTNSLNNYCFNNSTDIIKWNLKYKNNKTPETAFNYEKLKKEHSRKEYSFELIFKNNCTYVLSLQDLNIAKTYKCYVCKDGNIKKL
ncbi:hypothetical protein H8356DRAFT_433369 [Neocallimastix lanati (nom. inval.)]|nr:hypothetical protein H8356DRAFT_433369 [Neocallimastix sp. JGI-2020a]